jgi:hypothetical protein
VKWRLRFGAESAAFQTAKKRAVVAVARKLQVGFDLSVASTH